MSSEAQTALSDAAGDILDLDFAIGGIVASSVKLAAGSKVQSLP